MATYVFDLDGTLCTHVEDYAKAEPIHHRIKRVNRLARQGHTIIIDTARGTETGIHWESITREQLSEWGVDYHFLRCGQKFAADYYIDDKALNLKDFDERF